MSVRLGIVDDHGLVREGLRRILDAQPDLEVVGEAADVTEALTLAAEKRPDVMLVDLTLDDGDGVTLVRQLRERHPSLRVVVVTMHQHPETVRQAFLAGAAGYVIKGAASAELLTAIRAVAKHQHYVHPLVASVVVDDSLRWLRQSDRLSPREAEVVRLVASGQTAVQAARTLGISAHTIRRHVANVSNRLNLHGRAGLTRYALQHHLLNDES